MILGKASIVITCYNLEAYIAQAIEAALVQAHLDTEVIVVNDGSTDDSLRVIREYESRITLINQKNLGVGAARDNGISKSQGEYILPLDGDDWISSGYLSKTVPMMTDPTVGIVSTDMQYFGLRHDLIRTTGFTLETEMASNQLPICSLIRRAAYEQTPGYAQKSITDTIQDWNMWIDILKHGWRVAYVPEPLFHYRVRERSMSALAAGQEFRYAEEIRKNHPELNWSCT